MNIYYAETVRKKPFNQNLKAFSTKYILKGLKALCNLILTPVKTSN